MVSSWCLGGSLCQLYHLQEGLELPLLECVPSLRRRRVLGPPVVARGDLLCRVSLVVVYGSFVQHYRSPLLSGFLLFPVFHKSSSLELNRCSSLVVQLLVFFRVVCFCCHLKQSLAA